jgi:zinc and cadmium transporter
MTMFEWGSPWLNALAAATLVVMVSLSGAAVLWIRESTLRIVVPMLVAMAVGVLLGDAFLHLIPEAAEQLGSIATVGVYTMGGFVLFFAIEKGVRWQHRPDIHASDGSGNIQPMARMNLIGDAAHNFMDGILIAGSFSVDPVLGWATTAAIIMHEIPQELGDIGALLCRGYTPGRAVILNFICALAVIPGVLVTFLAGQVFHPLEMYLLPVAAGGFIYIAAADFLPALHRGESLRASTAQVAVVSLGMLSMYGVMLFEGAMGAHG